MISSLSTQLDKQECPKSITPGLWIKNKLIRQPVNEILSVNTT